MIICSQDQAASNGKKILMSISDRTKKVDLGISGYHSGPVFVPLSVECRHGGKHDNIDFRQVELVSDYFKRRCWQIIPLNPEGGGGGNYLP